MSTIYKDYTYYKMVTCTLHLLRRRSELPRVFSPGGTFVPQEQECGASHLEETHRTEETRVRRHSSETLLVAQGLLNVPFWVYWTSPKIVAIIDHIPNGIQWLGDVKHGDMTNDPCG